ncbi:MAG: prephenate dehydrogenase [Phycisphaerae bacterium]
MRLTAGGGAAKLRAMSEGGFRCVTIVGVGLLGGSLGLALKARSPSVRICGVGRRRSSLDEALACGAIDEAYLEAADPARDSDLVVLATPVGAFEKHLRDIAPVLDDDAVVTDVGSTKAFVVRAAQRALGRDGPFVGSHPMAGSEKKGVAHASADLFEGATCVITPMPAAPAAAAERIEKLWRSLGMRTLRMSPEQHDRAVAAVSHMPHALSAILALLPEDEQLDVAATGFRDMTRLAGGDPEVWRDILVTNRDAIVESLDAMDESLARLRDMLELADAPGIEALLGEAKARRDQHNNGS